MTELPNGDIGYLGLFQYGDIGFGINGIVILECQELIKEIEIPDYIDGKPVLIIGQKAFFSCKQLINISLPQKLLRIDDYAFMGCASLKKIIIPNDVVFIGRRAFRACFELSTVTFPKNLKEVGEGSFGTCEQLTSVKIPKQTILRENAFHENTQITYYDE